MPKMHQNTLGGQPEGGSLCAPPNQNLSNLFLNSFTDVASTTSWDNLFHSRATRWLNANFRTSRLVRCFDIDSFMVHVCPFNWRTEVLSGSLATWPSMAFRLITVHSPNPNRNGGRCPGGKRPDTIWFPHTAHVTCSHLESRVLPRAICSHGIKMSRTLFTTGHANTE